ncbi:MAG: 3-deoxy-D-manno-octulosonic acid transferase [Kiritimatiellae bacterium]|nr:3-deoxy-D-manno-octulosonic acid transferase [Kiritimatiellia bacterium]
MKWIVYNALFFVAYAVMLPSFLLRMKRRGGYKARMGDRFAKYPADIVEKLSVDDGASRIWIHAVSVGEVQVAGQLMRSLRKAEPSVRFVFSTTSSTGWRTAQKEVGDGDVLIYNPLDFPWLVKKAFDAVRPRAVVLTETEIWPNFIREAKKRNIPLFLANARISDRSAPRYKSLKFFFGDIFRSFAKMYVQSDLDASRLEAAGANRSDMEVTGSFKFDVAKRNPDKEAELRLWVGDGRILLGGSTWPGEDEALLRILPSLPNDVKLVIAPRHFEKADAVEGNIKKAGFGCIRRSRGESVSTASESLLGKSVFLADTTGELMGLFGIASAAFVGKSLCEHGSQNMIEPCLCGIPTVVGPYTENFRPVMSDLLAADAIVQVKDESELGIAVRKFFNESDSECARILGERAKAAVERRRGATDRCARDILSFLG